MIRTTVTLQDDTHEQLMLRSFKEKKSLGKIIDELVRTPVTRLTDAQIEASLKGLRKIGNKIKVEIGNVNAVDVVRAERDRDNAQADN